MTTDPIADLLTRIRNAIQTCKEKCEVPASTLKENILKVLKEEGYILGYSRQEQQPQDKLTVELKYVGKHHKSVIHEIKRVSKPGRRVYKGIDELYPLMGGGVGLYILSTPKGVVTDGSAKKLNVGGEVLCQVW
jgi:small subunit ribosomal protein S8